MNPIFLGGALGALAMYFLDPHEGRRRRARTRDKVIHAGKKLNEAGKVTARDTVHRARGVLASTRKLFKHEEVPDEVLLGRVRAATNKSLGALVGLTDAAHGIVVQKTINVDAPVEEVFAFWTDYQNFPRFMHNVREIHVLEDVSHWVVAGPAGVPVEWNARLV